MDVRDETESEYPSIVFLSIFLPCWICQVFPLHYLVFDGDTNTTLILSDGYWSAVTSDKVTAIKIGKGVPKCILRSADLVIECISHVQFLIEGKYLLRIRAWFNITETALGENEIPTRLGIPK